MALPRVLRVLRVLCGFGRCANLYPELAAESCRSHLHGEHSQVVEGACLWHRRSRVRIPLLAPTFQFKPFDAPDRAPVAQWTEHWASDPGVAGSSPARRATRKFSRRQKSRRLSFSVIPAKAGIQNPHYERSMRSQRRLDSRFRGNDGSGREWRKANSVWRPW